MTSHLLILVREFAYKRAIPAVEVYPIIKVEDRSLVAFYVSGKGFFPFENRT